MRVTKAASLADDLVQRFEEQIETGEMPAGSRFPTEKAITEAFGVSRTVVREAYSRPAARAARRRPDADLAAIRDALDAMENSEDVDASVVADAAFHAAIAAATRNDYFLRFTQFLGVRLVPSRKLYLQGSDRQRHQQYARTINRDHQAIYDAILAGDPAAARRAARRHMDKSIARYRAMQDGLPAEAAED